MSPSKPDRPPPPPPPPRKHEHGIDNEEPEKKHRKLENEDLSPLKPPRLDSPDKPPRLDSPDKPKSPVKSKTLDSFRTDKPPDSSDIKRETDLSDQGKISSLGNKLQETDNNRNAVEEVGNSKQGSHTTGHDNEVPPLQEEGPLEAGEQNRSGASVGNSTGEALS